jgi:hypothetical protein
VNAWYFTTLILLALPLGTTFGHALEMPPKMQFDESVCVRAPLCTADASTSEEPDAGKLHVRDCTGGAG